MWMCTPDPRSHTLAMRRASIPRARCAIVGGHLLYKGEELAIEGDDDPLLALQARRRAHVHEKVDGGHDAVAALLVDERLDRQAVVRDSLIPDQPSEPSRASVST